jgi:RimJ/RimL family protein N-acetyltransferase
MKHAEAQDWASIYLETTDGLEASMALYRRLGFKVEIAEDRPLWHGGGRFIQMRKAL